MIILDFMFVSMVSFIILHLEYWHFLWTNGSLSPRTKLYKFFHFSRLFLHPQATFLFLRSDILHGYLKNPKNPKCMQMANSYGIMEHLWLTTIILGALHVESSILVTKKSINSSVTFLWYIGPHGSLRKSIIERKKFKSRWIKYSC